MAAHQGRPTSEKTRQAEGHARAGEAALASGDLAKALSAYFHALALAPRNAGYLHTAVALIGVTDGYVLPPIIKDILADATKSADFDCQPLSTAVRSGLVGDPVGREVLALVEPGGDALEAALTGTKFDAVLNDRLLRAVLRRAVIDSPELEALITGLRRHALARVAASEPSVLLDRKLDLLVSVALQCFNAVYAFQVSEEEQGWLNTMLAKGLPSEAAKLAVIGAYRSLWDVIGHKPSPKIADGSPLAELFRRQIAEPRRERALRDKIPHLTPIEAGLSERVRDQYDDFPYPRWFAVDFARPRPFRQIIEERFPKLDFGGLPRYGVDVLIPGCGTGRQIAQLAAMVKSARITAVDLSLTALAYAKRQLDERKVKVHRFGQADILAMGDWQDRFDYIECMGVLHHLERPEDGLAVLTWLLQPHGVLHLGLYSERARQEILAARRLVAEHDPPHTPEGVRAARKLIASLPADDPARDVMTSRDFYSTSGLHDLIFNVHECRFTPLGLKALQDGAELDFLGFDHIDPTVEGRYRERFPADTEQTDLANWDAFEEDNPDTFSGMFQFWCRPKVA